MYALLPRTKKQPVGQVSSTYIFISYWVSCTKFGVKNARGDDTTRTAENKKMLRCTGEIIPRERTPSNQYTERTHSAMM